MPSRSAIMGFILPGVDNYAHGGGFLGGYLAGMWLDPLKPERMDHLVGAALCLVLTGARDRGLGRHGCHFE